MKTRIHFLLFFLLPALKWNTASAKTTFIYKTRRYVLRAAPLSYLEVTLINDAANKDETSIIFNDAASQAYNASEDAIYLKGNSVANLWSSSGDNVALAINKLPFPAQSENIPLNITAVYSGVYQLNLTYAQNIPQMYEVWLVDAYKKDSVDFKNNPNYTFNLSDNDTRSGGGKRFSLVIHNSAAYPYKLLTFTGTKTNGGAQLNWTTVNEATSTQFALQRSTHEGKNFTSVNSLQSTGAGNYSFLDASPATGVNQYRLLQRGLNGNTTYSSIVELTYQVPGSPTTGAISLYPNRAGSVINIEVLNTANAAANYTITIMDYRGSMVKTAECWQATRQSDTSGLAPGVYIMQVINNVDKSIVGINKFIKL